DNPQTLFPIADVQSGVDERQIAIDQVGIKGLRYPLLFADADGHAQPIIADCNVYVSLPQDRKGTHMSRLVALLESRTESGVPLFLSEVIRIAEEESSCELYGLLKRADEKYVTERAYDNPKFVEDLVRDVALRLQSDPRIEGFMVEAENFESIHNHSAYARI